MENSMWIQKRKKNMISSVGDHKCFIFFSRFDIFRKHEGGEQNNFMEFLGFFMKTRNVENFELIAEAWGHKIIMIFLYKFVENEFTSPTIRILCKYEQRRPDLKQSERFLRTNSTWTDAFSSFLKQRKNFKSGLSFHCITWLKREKKIPFQSPDSSINRKFQANMFHPIKMRISKEKPTNKKYWENFKIGIPYHGIVNIMAKNKLSK